MCAVGGSPIIQVMSSEERELNKDTIIATAAYVQQPYRVSYRQVPLRPPGLTEVVIDVLACGVCGHDLEIIPLLSASVASSFQV